MMIVMMAMIVFAVEVGYLYVVRGQLQNAADAAALAACWDLMDEDRFQGEAAGAFATARERAQQYARMNLVLGVECDVPDNPWNQPDADLVIGRLNDPTNHQETLSVTGDPAQFNSILVRVRRDSQVNGQVPLFFSRLLSVDSASLTAEAVASFQDSLIGFSRPAITPSSAVIPFAVEQREFEFLLDGIGPDSWAFDKSTSQLSLGGDNIPEMNLYPDRTGGGQGNSGVTPGNFGTVVIGGTSGASTLVRQLQSGLSEADLAYHGGALQLSEADGTLELSGNTGLSAGMEGALHDLVGETRIILLYRDVVDPGANAAFTISGFAGVRILDVDLHGKEKHVTIQPAHIPTSGIVGNVGSSYFVSPRPRLVR
jgi:Flp pilus assembly protein TadG